MNMPEKWSGDYLTRLLQGAALGVIVTIAVGFSWTGYGFGWTLGGTAEKMANERTEAAVVAALAPLCAQRYVENATPAQRVAFGKESSWARDGEIADMGFAAFQNAAEFKSEIADKCASLLSAQLEKAEKAAEATKG
jgi:hypothetical protein